MSNTLLNLLKTQIKKQKTIKICGYIKEKLYFCIINNDKKELMAQDINRLKVVLAEQKRTNKWLAEQLGKDPASVSKWCTNASQPSLETLVEIAKCLNVDVKDLLWSTKER